jgi:hypothetical protein
MGEAGLDRPVRDLAPLVVEQRELAARLDQSPLQIPPLRLGRPGALRLVAVASRMLALFHRHTPILMTALLTMIKKRLPSQFLSAAEADRITERRSEVFAALRAALSVGVPITRA